MCDMALQIPEYFYLLAATSNYGLLTLRWHSATKKQLFLHPQGDQSRLRKKNEHQD